MTFEIRFKPPHPARHPERLERTRLPRPSPLNRCREEKGEKKRQTLLEKINAMLPSEKIKAALTGNMEERLLLIRDSNKLVARAVLGSPKLTDQEIENFASMKNVTEEVLRLISHEPQIHEELRRDAATHQQSKHAHRCRASSDSSFE